MKRILLEVAYDGTDYHGWQYQPGRKTIEGVLNQMLSEMLHEEIQVIGASRTDAGVHAYGNVAVFDTKSSIPPDKMAYAINTYLPDDIKARRSCEVAADFHPRKCESRKTYEYRILACAYPIPTERRTSYYTYQPLNTEAMQRAATYLVGEHDFTSFCCVHTQALSPIRTIHSAEVLTDGAHITIRITGNGFLYNMVRIIAGTLMEVGRGKYQPEYVREILALKDRSAAGFTAPPEGLFLIKYEFLPDCVKKQLTL